MEINMSANWALCFRVELLFVSELEVNGPLLCNLLLPLPLYMCHLLVIFCSLTPVFPSNSRTLCAACCELKLTHKLQA